MNTRIVWLIPLWMALLVPSCTTKSAARKQAAQAFAAGQGQALRQSQTRPPSEQPLVTVVGPVRLHLVPWQQGLTLALAIDAAVYTGVTDPQIILLRRGLETVEIKVNDLLRGTDNQELERGDIIEIR